MTNQIKNRNQVRAGRKAINAPQDNIPSTGNNGLKGVVKGRGIDGCVIRKTTTPKQTKTKAAKVPILTSSAKSPKGIKPAISAIIKPQSTITRMGVWVSGFNLLKKGDSSPSRDIAKIIRVSP